MKCKKYLYPVVLEGNSINIIDFKYVFKKNIVDIDDIYDITESIITELADNIIETGGKLPLPSKFIPSGEETVLYIPYIVEWSDFKSRHSNYIKKNITIQEWHNIYAKKLGLNFSQLLQEAIERKVEIYMNKGGQL